VIILDTNIVIFLLNGEKNIEKALSDYSPSEVALSFISVGELVFGAHHSKRNKENLGRVLSFANTVQVMDSCKEISLIYGELKARSFELGLFPGDNDLWIASTVLYEKATLITRNLKHFNWIRELKTESW